MDNVELSWNSLKQEVPPVAFVILVITGKEPLTKQHHNTNQQAHCPALPPVPGASSSNLAENRRVPNGP